jgi:hypothetical protein
MNLERVEQIAKAVLYEGYMLYPYRPSSVKNRQRWNFGVVYPNAYSEMQDSGEPSTVQAEFLVEGSDDTALEVKLRFLHLRTRTSEGMIQGPGGSSLPDGWQEAVERDVSLPPTPLADIATESLHHEFSFPGETRFDAERNGDRSVATVVRNQDAIQGTVALSIIRIGPCLFKASVLVRNATPLKNPAAHRDDALMQSLVSTHLVLGVTGGEFVSLLEPPNAFQDAASQCQNVGVWPVLVGEAGQRDTMLASPIILYDYPQIAPESVGDLFDGTEIDEILSLRIMTLTDEEKREIRNSDQRARQILERTDSMPAEQFMKLHGAVRSLRPLKEDAS